MLVNPRWLYFILSVCQLNLLGYIGKDKSEYIISIVAEYLSLKCNIRYKVSKLRSLFQRSIDGKIVEQIYVELTSTQFDSELEIMLAKANIFLTKDGFSSGAALPKFTGP